MTPEQEEQVRRALAASAQADRAPRMPPEVAARLDGVLADLVAPRLDPAAGRDPSDAVHLDQLAARRRRGHRLLVAAAVTVVALAGGAVVAGGLDGSGDRSASSARSAHSAGHGPTPAAPPPGSAQEAAGAPVLRSGTLARDVQRVVDHPTALSSAPRSQARLAPGTAGSAGVSGSQGPRPVCARPSTAPGGFVGAVRLDGRPAILVVAAPVGGQRVARVLSCADGGLLARTTVRAR